GDNHFKEAEELSKGIRWIPRREGRPLRRARCPAVAPERRNCAEPIENRGYHSEREDVSCRARRVRESRRVPLEVCWRQANPELLAHHGGGAGTHGRVRRDEPRSVAARSQVRRLHDLLRVDASDRYG